MNKEESSAVRLCRHHDIGVLCQFQLGRLPIIQPEP